MCVCVCVCVCVLVCMCVCVCWCVCVCVCVCVCDGGNMCVMAPQVKEWKGKMRREQRVVDRQIRG